MATYTINWWTEISGVTPEQITTVTINLEKGGVDGLTPYIGNNGNWFIGLTDTGKRAEANSIESIVLLSKVGFVATYRITFTYGEIFDYTVSDGAQGIKGDKGDIGEPGLPSSISLNGTTYENDGGVITLPDLLTPDGDSSLTESDGDVFDFDEPFPDAGVFYAIRLWFGIIKAKIVYLFANTLFKTGNGSDTTVNFVEPITTSLPVTGETQSTLWGKVLRYFKTEIPALFSSVYDTIYQQFKETSFQGAVNVYYRYIDGVRVLSLTAPTAAENIPFALTGSTTSTYTISGQIGRAGFYSPKSTYAKSLYFGGLTQNTKYTFVMTYKIKNIPIYQVEGEFTTAQGQKSYLFNMQIPNSLVYQSEIQYLATDTFDESFAITKNTAPNGTIYLTSNPSLGQISTMIRYGGVIYGTDIFLESVNKTADALAAETLIDSDVVQTTGASTSLIMSQKATTDAIDTAIQTAIYDSWTSSY